MRIAIAVRVYGNIDGLCSIESACLAAAARAAAVLGLPTESPDAVACAGNMYEVRLVVAEGGPTALIADVPDVRNRKQFFPNIHSPSSRL